MKKKGKRAQKNEEGLEEELDEKDDILPEPQSQVMCCNFILKIWPDVPHRMRLSF